MGLAPSFQPCRMCIGGRWSMNNLLDKPLLHDLWTKHGPHRPTKRPLLEELSQGSSQPDFAAELVLPRWLLTCFKEALLSRYTIPTFDYSCGYNFCTALLGIRASVSPNDGCLVSPPKPVRSEPTKHSLYTWPRRPCIRPSRRPADEVRASLGPKARPCG